MFALCLAGVTSVYSQDRRSARGAPEQEPLKLEATLIQVPAVVSDRSGKFVTDLSRADFEIFEDGKRQEISVFAAVKQPFSAVLVIDTSNSAADRLKAIKGSAVAFLQQIRPDDRALIITFDHEVRELTGFTSDKAEMEAAIQAAESGFGKLLYDAMALALTRLRDVEGRRAVVLFSDCVDMRSPDQTSASVASLAEEAAATIYTIQFETRWWLEHEARKRRSEERSKIQFGGDVRIPLPPDLGGPDASPPGAPRSRRPRIEIEGGPGVRFPDSRGANLPGDGRPDEITQNLDKLYGEADEFAQLLASRSGGRVFRADTVRDVNAAFASIAEELRNQYLLGYYTRGTAGGKFRKLKVEVRTKGLQVRARSGFTG
jgi:VWFA-related protein